MSNVIDLASRRARQVPSTEILHPAGIRVPIDDPACADFVAPEMRGEIDSGSYSADLIAHLAESDFSDERVLVIGIGGGEILADRRT